MLVYLVVLFLLLSWAGGGFRMNQVKLSHTQIVELFREEAVKSFVIQGNAIELTLHGTYDGKEKIVCSLGDADYFLAQTDSLLAAQLESGVLEDYNFLPAETVTPMDYVVPLLIAGVILLLLWFILMSRATAGGGGPASNFGKARTVVGIPDGREVTFKDVAGADEEKQEIVRKSGVRVSVGFDGHRVEDYLPDRVAGYCKKLTELGLPGENDTVFISHGDCVEDARYLEELLKERCGVKNVIISYVGAVIGSHSGPGTLALFFLGNKR